MTKKQLLNSTLAISLLASQTCAPLSAHIPAHNPQSGLRLGFGMGVADLSADMRCENIQNGDLQSRGHRKSKDTGKVFSMHIDYDHYIDNLLLSAGLDWTYNSANAESENHVENITNVIPNQRNRYIARIQHRNNINLTLRAGLKNKICTPYLLTNLSYGDFKISGKTDYSAPLEQDHTKTKTHKLFGLGYGFGVTRNFDVFDMSLEFSRTHYQKPKTKDYDNEPGNFYLNITSRRITENKIILKASLPLV